MIMETILKDVSMNLRIAAISFEIVCMLTRSRLKDNYLSL